MTQIRHRVKAKNRANSAAREITTGNLRLLCWQAGFHGVAGLAREIGRSRITVHRAVRWPDQFGPTYKLIQEKLAA